MISVALTQGVIVPETVVEDVAPWASSDPRGEVLASSSLPLTIAGIFLGAIVAFRFTRPFLQITLLLGASLLTGLSFALILGPGLNILSTNVVLSVAAISAVMAACAAALVGVTRIAGQTGFGVLGLVLALVGNPLAGVVLPAGFYPVFWANLGQAMPLGAGLELIQRITYFPTADTTLLWWTLAAWAGAGVALSLLGIAFKRSDVTNARHLEASPQPVE